jgi:phenylpropionate dioxygenase-like ring-hydroxylating dioxygenase large terminal subunit
MEHAAQVALAARLLDHIDAGTLDLAAAVYRQPVAEYTCRTQAARERERLLRGRPLCVGLAGDLPSPGSYRVHDLGGQPLLLLRDAAGRFRAFLNVCRHRGARVAEGCGEARGFTCPYHAWAYGLDGTLVGRPEEAAFPGIERTTHGLTPLAAAERHGLLWVHPAVGAGCDPAGHLGDLDTELAGFGLGGFHPYGSRLLRRRMNWKLALDTFLESYHFCVLHKDSICSIFHQNLASFDADGEHFRLVTPRRSIARLREEPQAEWRVLPHLVILYVLFPNSVLVWQGEQVEFWQIFPDGDDPGASLLHLTLYTPTPADSDKARRHWDRNLELVLHVVENEDFPVGEAIQAGFDSGAQSHLLFGRNEPALAHFHRAISAATGTSP